MRILVVSNLYPPHYVGGYELRCRAITEALAGKGHEMQVITSNHTVDGAEESPHGSYEIHRQLRVHGFFGHPWVGISKLRELEEHNNAALLTSILKFKPDVVHVWNLGGISKSLGLTLQRLNIPTVYDVSDHWIARSLVGDVWLDWWNRSRTSPAARVARAAWTASGARTSFHTTAPTNPIQHLKFQRLYFCSARLRQITMDAGYDVAHGEVIHCPVDINMYHGNIRPGTEPVRNLLYAGRLSEDKGILTALRAMQLLKETSGTHLHVYGKGEASYESMLKGYALEHSLPVSFHSATPAQMPDVYRRHDALLFTSEWEEPFALTPLEAMASGLPVIGTMTGGSAELLHDGRNAFTYSAGDAGELASQILRLQHDADVRTHIATTGKQEVLQRLAMPMIVSQVERYLEETLTRWEATTLPPYDSK